MHSLDTNSENLSMFREIKDVGHIDIKSLNVLMGGSFEAKELLSGDWLLINIQDQKDQTKKVNSIASSLIRQKVYGPCLLLSPLEATNVNMKKAMVY